MSDNVYASGVVGARSGNNAGNGPMPPSLALPDSDEARGQLADDRTSTPRQDTVDAVTEITKPPRIGDQDPNLGQIDDIFWSTRKFVIYESNGQIRYMLPEDYETAKALRRRIADLGGLRASIEDLRAELSLSAIEKKRAAREVAWALAEAFEDDGAPPSEKPTEVLKRVDERLRSLAKSEHRKTYAKANLVAFASIEVVLLTLAITLSYWNFGGGPLSAMARYAVFCAFGALGAFLSVIIGIRSIAVDLDLKGWEHVFAGATRIMIGVIGALVISLALDSSLIDPTFGARSDEQILQEAEAMTAPATAEPKAEQAASLGGIDNILAMYLIFAFIAGFSERLVPNLLRRGEQAAGGQDHQDDGDGPIVEQISPNSIVGVPLPKAANQSSPQASTNGEPYLPCRHNLIGFW